jgi:hypothetical protein
LGIALNYVRVGGVPYLWKYLNKGYNFVLDLTLIRCLHMKLWASKVARVPIIKISGLPTWESWEKWHLHAALVVNHKKSYKGGRWWFLPNSGCGKFFESMYAHGSFVHQKCFNYALTNLLFGLCRSIWIVDLLFIHSNIHLGALACPSYP